MKVPPRDSPTRAVATSCTMACIFAVHSLIRSVSRERHTEHISEKWHVLDEDGTEVTRESLASAQGIGL